MPAGSLTEQIINVSLDHEVQSESSPWNPKLDKEKEQPLNRKPG
jgi:hypothetical protein